MINKVLGSAAVVLAIAAGVLLWRLNVLSDDLETANKTNGQLEQSNKQLSADLGSERQKTRDLESSYQLEQSKVAELVEDLERAKQEEPQRQKAAYEAANQSNCGVQPLPDELIELRRSRTSRASGQN